jgi:hypothetical protein
MIVLGMAQKQVTHCVGLGFKDIAHAEAAYKGGGNTEQEKAVARYAYGEFYIKKLVNIVAPLPKTTPEQRRRVLEVRAAEAREAEEQKASSAKWRSSLWDWASQCGGMIARTAPVIALMAAIVLSVLIGYKEGIPLPPPKPGSQSSGSPSSSTVQPTASGGGAANPSIAKPLVYSRPASQPATLIAPDGTAGGVWWSYAVDALFLFVLFGILAYQLSARTNLDAQNSPDFEDSLKLWGQYIVGVCDTPREIKRTLNDLRYLAMTRRTNGPSSTRVERLIRTIRQLVTGRTENVPIEARVDEAALPPLKAAELASLTDEERARFLDLTDVDVQGSANLHRLIELKHEHIKHFGRWIGEARIEPPPDAPATGSAPPAKAAGQG